jgi:hypothetical protein
VVASNLAAGVWGLTLWRRKQTGDRTFWIALAIAWGTVIIQGFMGLLLFERYQPEFRHHFYGFLFVVIMLVVLPVRTEQPRTRLLVFSVATLFIGIVAVRAVSSV